ncbi:type VI secretion system-associated protein TagF [Chitinolyticbacter albus]|uniref:type VI secretion system-associated protein TagF n=1 Tax=Chitinolyticbacter albus TaxID=2961951 RepID=UPI00210E0E51|nr:type VI secretion system-associated protein TagF [Chitinolyticbacter albus]
MPISFMRTQDALPQYSVFGKLPRRADFVRINASHPVAQEFDELLAKSLTLASQQPGWNEDTYLNAGASDFHYTSNDGRWCFFGVLQPSRDEAGRLYPLVAGAILPAQAVAPHAAELSIANELFFAGLRDQLATAIDNSVEMLACRQFLDAQLTQNAHANADVELAIQVLERHLKRTAASQLQADLAEAGHGELDAHLLAFVFYAELLRRYGASAPKQVVLLPLPKKAGEDTLGQATWLAIYRASMRVSASRFPDFISVVRNGRRYLAVAPERFSERFLAVLWGLEPDPLSVLDVNAEDAPWTHHQAYAEASYILGRQLQDPGFNLESLLSITKKLTTSLA